MRRQAEGTSTVVVGVSRYTHLEKKRGQDRTAGIAVHTRPRVLRCGVLGERKRATRSAVLYGEVRHGRDARAWGFICHDAQGSHVRRHVTCFLSPSVLVRTQRPHGVGLVRELVFVSRRVMGPALAGI